MMERLDAMAYSEHWEKESMLFGSTGVYGRLSEITPVENVLEIGSGIGLGTLALAASRKVLAIDSNVHLVEKARSRITASGASAEIVVADVFAPSPECVQAIDRFAPKVIVGWLLGSNADDQEKYVAPDVRFSERPKRYRENLEDALLTKNICPPTVEWVHLVNRGGRIIGANSELVKSETKADYDEHVFLPNGFEVVDVQILDWDRAGSSFQYGAADNPNLMPGQSMPVFISVLARRKRS